MTTKTKVTAPMNGSWLVQRLEKPAASWLGMKDNPFSFGGGLVNGGLSSSAMDLLRGVFSFDYMGAAEFEWGAVPKALREIAEAKDLAASSFTVSLADVPANWRLAKDAPKPDGDATLYVLCRRAHEVEVRSRITGWATGKERLQEPTRLPATLRPHSDYDSRVVGWLELDNGFFFFTDRDMWAATARLFGVEVSPA